MTSDRHKISHTDREYEQNGTVRLPYILDFVDDFMRNRNFSIEVLHVKCQIFTYFCDIISLIAQVCMV